jgi:hypothetical protein
MPMRNSSTATADSCVFCAPGSRPAHPRHPAAPYEFGVKASIVTTNAQDRRPRGLRGGIRLATLAGRSDPLAAATPARLEALFLPRCVFISGPKARGLRPHQTRAQTSLRHRGGDRTNESKAISAAAISKVAPAMPPTFILSAVGYNLRLVLAWLRMIFARHPLALLQTSRFGSTNWIFNGRRTRTASFSCPLWPRQANDDS